MDWSTNFSRGASGKSSTNFRRPLPRVFPYILLSSLLPLKQLGMYSWVVTLQQVAMHRPFRQAPGWPAAVLHGGLSLCRLPRSRSRKGKPARPAQEKPAKDRLGRWWRRAARLGSRHQAAAAFLGRMIMFTGETSLWRSFWQRLTSTHPIDLDRIQGLRDALTRYCQQNPARCPALGH